MSMQDRIRQVEARIGQACLRSGRKREDVNVIAVTKYVSTETAREAVECGLQHVGENRWQDAQAKWEAIGPDAVWHFIGHLQSNKVKDVVGKFAYIHSLDRLSLAKELDRHAAKLGISVDCFIQVNVSGEETKYGLPPEQLIPFAEQLSAYPNIRIAGLMTMAPYEAEAEATRPVFRGLRELRDRLNESGTLGYSVEHLSMGMSGDFEVAIEEGATWVRLGTVLVGKEG
ncbi:YggS family pyridoxal phosphate-dependent enzyme [Paenibacillus mesophilus]|uniref:YggS family pyridoxal phosphate-dependent enzyme n=1 Tax=Paenibacillus mesophilus TaxID=2582849 RepID=UPI00110E5DA7|nr:YggS family pyridoxal phosphate-dependent enzyme [Paenibacillus mesophilus]TMV46648.1 YggS family pyridoxal phosphate-dependent enzyme [Paenibacillus mesophilus]